MRRSLLSTVSFVLKILMSRTKSLKNHGVKVHGKKITVDWSSKKFSCRLCYSRFDKAANLKAHQKVHKEDLDLFDKTFIDEDLSFECSDCGWRFITRNILDFHNRKEHSRALKYEDQMKSSYDPTEKRCKCILC